jgi:hypothetical protein
VRLFEWDNPEKYYLQAMGLLNEKFNLGFTEKLRIEKVNGGETIKISSKSNSVLIKLADKKHTAILATADKKTYELGVETSDDKSYVGIRIDTYKEYYFDRFVRDMQSNLFALAVSILLISSITHKEIMKFNEK